MSNEKLKTEKQSIVCDLLDLEDLKNKEELIVDLLGNNCNYKQVTLDIFKIEHKFQQRMNSLDQRNKLLNIYEIYDLLNNDINCLAHFHDLPEELILVLTRNKVIVLDL